MAGRTLGPVSSDTAEVEAPPGISLRRWRVFPGHGRQLGLMRRWLESVLPEGPARDDVASVASELASNAIRHTRSGRGGAFVVEIAATRETVRVAVTDGGALQEPRFVENPGGESGRGLALVRALARNTGVRGDRRSRMVWAELPWPGDAIVGTPNDKPAFVIDHLSASAPASAG